jgi:hypothetical protein
VKEFLVIVLVELGTGEGFLVLDPISEGCRKSGGISEVLAEGEDSGEGGYTA